MTQNKRFSHKKWYDERQLFDGDDPFAIVDVYNQADTICDLLNELDENWINELNLRETLQLELQRVEEENKQLKQGIVDCLFKGESLQIFAEEMGLIECLNDSQSSI